MDDGSRLPRRGPAKVIDWIQGLFSGVFHFFKGEQEDSVTEKEIISMVDEAHEKGVLQKDEAEMIQNIFAFEDKEVGAVMTHRSSVAAFAMDDLLKDVVNHMMEEENSRYPVCGEDMDDIRGLIHYKDALKFFTQNPWAKFKPLKELPGLIRKATFVPETRHIGQLFRTMQARQVHMAVVVDEYGQLAGIVTMEDILEEIVGNIQDEYDMEEEDIVELPEYRLPEGPSPAEIQKALQTEGAAIRERLPRGGAVVALCIEGKPCSSEELSRRIIDFGVQGKTQITFLIGGSVGLDESIKKQADWRLSMSPMTFPHHMARIMLLEQIYRAYQIAAGTKYHK